MIATRFGLRVVGLRYEFYFLSARDPGYAKMIMPTLERRNEIAAAYDVTDTPEILDSHLTTKFMKALATINASNGPKKSGSRGNAGRY